MFDLREAKIATSIMETFRVASAHESLGWRKEYQAAVVFSRITEIERFIENIGVNRGVKISIFDDIDKGISWLAKA